ncbi:PAS domain-containing protein [Sulfurimonas sp. SAG-AH-194-C21]|nr:PAS domain-containing protein [Sulfurimonas sp. SAG-AH-194-C21]MDF1883422.1 PAS domain-containing protein [Sulfurimonas sp. SAG-AH-194-C21]
MSGIYKDKDSDEWFFPKDSYILSETDDKGIILYVNTVFCELAGYTPEELIGEPHNILRHSDMPRAAFASLWNDVQTKGFWTGIVKNLRKDRAYYWVHATVLRKIHSDGSATYLSVRTVPNRTEVEACIPLYSEWKSKE